MTHVSAEYVSSPATEIIYVADFSGSIIVAVDDLRRELKRQIDGLDPTEFFNVVVTYGDPTDRKGAVTKAFRPRPELATKEAQRGFCRWIDEQAPRGSTEPVVAMTYALSFKPDRIVLFSDGYFEDEAVDKINRANRGGATQIDCVVFDEVLLEDTSGMPRETRGTRRLRRIAEANNGEVRVLTGADLGR
jgi:hypothetical protein